MHVHVCRKDDIFRQRRLNHSGVGGGITFGRVYPARAYSTVVVLVSLCLNKNKLLNIEGVDQVLSQSGSWVW